MAGALAQNLYLDRTFAFSQQVDDAMAKLTLDELNAVWRKYIERERLVLAWGGDFEPPSRRPSVRRRRQCRAGPLRASQGEEPVRMAAGGGALR